MILLMSNPAVAFLIWFILTVIIVAVMLIGIETWIKKKTKVKGVKETKEMEDKIETPIDKLRSFISSDVSLKEKLDFIEKTAKDILRKKYGISRVLTYDKLAENFEKDGMPMEADFCKKIFRSYYSKDNLTEAKLKELENILANIYVKVPCTNNTWKVPDFFDGVSEFAEEVREAVIDDSSRYFSHKKNKIKKHIDSPINNNRKLDNLASKVISAGQNKSKIFRIPRSEKSKNKINNTLEVYNKIAIVSKREKTQEYVNEYCGIAQKIVQNEKNRLRSISPNGEF